MNNADITQLEPKAVWQWFSQICAIPHPTFHEQALGQYIIGKAQERGLKVQQDAKGNIRIEKPGTKGFEDKPTVGLQAHMDMVPQKSADSNHDFLKDPIQLQVENGWIHANKTTLGSDNGVGLSMALAVAFSTDIEHPPLVLIITVEEEVGMGGVIALDPEWVQMPYLLNLDTEDAGQLFVGCAGGSEGQFNLPITREPLTGQVFDVRIGGLNGGHSGIDIDKGRGNANIILARVLTVLYQAAPFSLLVLEGGTLRNALPRDAFACLVFKEIPQNLDVIVSDITQVIKKEFQTTEPTLTIKAACLPDEQTKLALSQQVVPLETTAKIIALLRLIPNGVQGMSQTFEGVVETSCNLGVVKLLENNFQATTLVRSLAQSPKEEIHERLRCLANLVGSDLAIEGDYPGWEPELNSKLLRLGKEIFARYYGVEPGIVVIHAGLECGILKGKATQTEMISFGPTIIGAHSPQEKVNISAVEECWTILLEYLREIAKL